MPKKKVRKLKKNDVIIYGENEHKITSLSWDDINKKVTILGTGGFAQSLSEDSEVTIK